MVEVMKKMMMSDPKWQALLRLFSDKQVAIRVLRKQREIRMRPESIQMFEEGYDPATHDGLVKFMDIYERVDKKTMEECGLSDYVKDVHLFKILKVIFPLYKNDPEIKAELEYTPEYTCAIGSLFETLNIGSAPPDINLVSIETKQEVALSQFHSRKPRPLVIIASSIS
ncbi:uncharacterized protein [Amphiura filiformis]|uniref:uncharacterized protein n=1 Tax=Amphiura filiformis TaxID=82378 RepID=UPI003B22002E